MGQAPDGTTDCLVFSMFQIWRQPRLLATPTR